MHSGVIHVHITAGIIALYSLLDAICIENALYNAFFSFACILIPYFTKLNRKLKKHTNLLMNSTLIKLMTSSIHFLIDQHLCIFYIYIYEKKIWLFLKYLQ